MNTDSPAMWQGIFEQMAADFWASRKAAPEVDRQEQLFVAFREHVAPQMRQLAEKASRARAAGLARVADRTLEPGDEDTVPAALAALRRAGMDGAAAAIEKAERAEIEGVAARELLDEIVLKLGRENVQGFGDLLAVYKEAFG